MQTTNGFAHLGKLSEELSDRNMELEQRIITQSSDIAHLMQMLANLTQKQGWSQELSCGR